MHILARLFAMAAAIASLVLFTTGQAQEPKAEVTLKGKITCAKCDLEKTPECVTVIVVKDKGKDVIIYFDEAAHTKYHDDVCTAAKKGTVVGTVKDADGKKVIRVKELTYE